jgi:hypothetical protein
VEGLIYKGGTIKGSGFDPSSAPSIGVWLCRGWFLIQKDRPEPHVVSTQEYVFGEIRPDRLYPPDQLVSSGMEGSEAEGQPAIRSVVGGSGKYAGATGGVEQHGNGTNTTTLTGMDAPAPNFRFKFELLLP